MGAEPLSILVTGAGAPGIRGTIYALRSNPEQRPVRIVGVDTDDDVVGRFLVDAFFQVPPPESPAYLDAIRSICRQEGVSLILPQTTREVVVLSRCKEELERDRLRIMVSDEQAIELANNKWTLLVRCQELGLPCPAFHIAGTEDELVGCVRKLGYPAQPVVVKPLVSNGMRGFRVLRSEPWDVLRFLAEKPPSGETSLDDLLRILRRGPGWPQLLVTEYLPGPEYSVDVFLGEKLAVALPRLRKTIRSGITFRSQTELRQDMVTFSLCIARDIGLRYAFGFQFKLDADSVPRILECNPRIQGTMVASVFSGANVIWFGVKELIGEPVCRLACRVAPSSFYRYWGGLGVRDGNATEI
jgi:carbamoyl-phosphate synthase large subunit